MVAFTASAVALQYGIGLVQEVSRHEAVWHQRNRSIPLRGIGDDCACAECAGEEEEGDESHWHGGERVWAVILYKAGSVHCALHCAPMTPRSQIDFRQQRTKNGRKEVKERKMLWKSLVLGSHQQGAM